MICELCGRNVSFLKPLLIEGSILKVCSNCAKFGKETTPKPTSAPAAGGNEKAQRQSGVSYFPASRSKDEIIRDRLEHRARRMHSKDVFEQSGEKELVEDYHKRIQQARTRLGWNQEQLGQKINERKSVISKLENRTMKPDDKLVGKLEKALEIKLMEVIE